MLNTVLFLGCVTGQTGTGRVFRPQSLWGEERSIFYDFITGCLGSTKHPSDYFCIIRTFMDLPEATVSLYRVWPRRLVVTSGVTAQLTRQSYVKCRIHCDLRCGRQFLNLPTTWCIRGCFNNYCKDKGRQTKNSNHQIQRGRGNERL